MGLSIKEAKSILLSDGIVAVPTETVYGLAGRADSKKAIEKIFAAKNRPGDNPLICHFHSIDQVKKYVKNISPLSLLLMHKFSPGPISFLLDIEKDSVLKVATTGRNSVIVRIPSHPVFLKLLKEIDVPLAAPSANTSGRVSATTADMVKKDLGKKIDGVLDGGISHVGIESTILDARKNKTINILRPGVIGKTELEHHLKNKHVRISYAVSPEATPGTKYAHYAPITPVIMITDEKKIAQQKKFLLLCTGESLHRMSDSTRSFLGNGNHIILSLGSEKELKTVAKNLFFTLSKIDDMQVKKAIYLENDWGATSLGVAIRNRLYKSFKK